MLLILSTVPEAPPSCMRTIACSVLSSPDGSGRFRSFCSPRPIVPPGGCNWQVNVVASCRCCTVNFMIGSAPWPETVVTSPSCRARLLCQRTDGRNAAAGLCVRACRFVGLVLRLCSLKNGAPGRVRFLGGKQGEIGIQCQNLFKSAGATALGFSQAFAECLVLECGRVQWDRTGAQRRRVCYLGNDCVILPCHKTFTYRPDLYFFGRG